MSALFLSINSSNYGLKSFAIKADDNPTIDLGGNTSTRSINGDGSGRKILTRKSWMIEGLNVAANISDGDLEYLQNVANEEADSVITYQQSPDITYTGLGSIEGDLKGSTNDGYVSLTLSGSGTLKAVK